MKEEKITTYEVRAQDLAKAVEEKQIIVTVTEPAPVTQKYTITIGYLENQKAELQKQIDELDAEIAKIKIAIA